ncbi:MAG TPA: thioesterase family protein [Terriglobales bacterium]
MQNSNHTGEARLRVRYAETDKMGVVYHANYIVWFEVGRVEFLRQLGFEYRLMEQEDDCHIAVAEVRCRFKAPARYDDEILVRTRVKHVRGPLIQFEYEIFQERTKTLLAEGESTHIVVNSKFERTTLPLKYAEAFERALIQENERQTNGD